MESVEVIKSTWAEFIATLFLTIIVNGYFQEDMVTEEVSLDARVHSRVIGARGRAIRKIMDDFKVDIKFPTRDAGDPDLVLLTGMEDNVLDCKDHLLNLEEEYVSWKFVLWEIYRW